MRALFRTSGALGVPRMCQRWLVLARDAVLSSPHWEMWQLSPPKGVGAASARQKVKATSVKEPQRSVTSWKAGLCLALRPVQLSPSARPCPAWDAQGKDNNACQGL